MEKGLVHIGTGIKPLSSIQGNVKAVNNKFSQEEWGVGTSLLTLVFLPWQGWEGGNCSLLSTYSTVLNMQTKVEYRQDEMINNLILKLSKHTVSMNKFPPLERT